MTAMRERERSGALQPIRNVRSRALVLKCVPKTSENATDRGLAQKQALAGARDVALGEQHVERRPPLHRRPRT